MHSDGKCGIASLRRLSWGRLWAPKPALSVSKRMLPSRSMAPDLEPFLQPRLVPVSPFRFDSDLGSAQRRPRGGKNPRRGRTSSRTSRGAVCLSRGAVCLSWLSTCCLLYRGLASAVFWTFSGSRVRAKKHRTWQRAAPTKLLWYERTHRWVSGGQEAKKLFDVCRNPQAAAAYWERWWCGNLPIKDLAYAAPLEGA